MPAKLTPASALAPLGFRLYNTGGGCTAFRAAYTDGTECLVTEAEDASTPDSMDSPVYIGLYHYGPDGEETHDAMMFQFPSLTAALPMLAARFDAELDRRDDPPRVWFEGGTLSGHHLVAESYPDSEPDVLFSIPDNSPLFRRDEWDKDMLRAAIAALQTELDRIEAQ